MATKNRLSQIEERFSRFLHATFHEISDFGMARRTDIHVPHEGGKFPIKWTAPEALKDSKFSMKSDVWSYGVFLWEVFSYGRTPYPSIPADDVLENIEDGCIMDPPDNCPKGIYDVMCRCWRMEPRERPTFRTLGEMLPSTLESVSRCPSPLPTCHTVTLPQIEELLRSSVASDVYREAPLTRKANMFVTNLTFLGPLGSGKTSLLRSFLGQTFRLAEPSTLSLLFSDSYFTLVDHSNWSSSSAPLMYEDELIRIIIDELLKQAQHLLSAERKLNEPQRGLAGVGGADGDAPSPISSLASIQKRSQSFSDVQGMIHSSAHDVVAVKASNRFSGSYEVMDSDRGKLQLGYGTDSDSDRGPPLPPERRHSGSRHTHRRNFISRFFTGKAKTKSGSSLQRHYSDSLKHSLYTGISQSNGNVSTTYFSSLPEPLIHKIRSELASLTDSSLPPKYFGKLIDMPGGRAFQALRSLFITDYSVCVLIYDASKNLDSSVLPGPRRKLSAGSSEGKANGIVPGGVPHDTYFNHVMSEFNNLCLHWSHSEADMTVRGPRIILVGTHSDKVPSSVSHNNFDRLRRAIQSSPYQKYVAMMKYVLSSSSLIERANMDDLKRFTIEVVKKSCRQQVPLKWLRCVRRFFGLSSRGIYFISLEDARKIVVDMCDLTPEEHVDDVIAFLRNNQVILHFSGVYQLRTIVFTNPSWFAQQLGTLFGAAWTTELNPSTLPRVKTDINLLQTHGIVTKHLLEHVWRDRFVAGCRDKLLAILHKMDLICCLGSNSQPMAPSLSPSSITQDVNGTATSDTPSALSVSSIIIPSVLTEPVPSHLSKLPTFMLEPLLFVFKNGFVPFGVFPRLIVRCIHSYPHRYTLYSNGALFEVDESTLLLVLEKKDHITVSLHRSLPPPSTSSSSSLGHVPSDLDEIVASYPEPPNLDTCMAIQMFLQAGISDIVQQWLPQVDYHLCIECKCMNNSLGVEGGGGSGSATHYIILSQTDDVLQRVSLDCENGSQVVIGPTLYSWFGEIPKPQSPTEDNADFITTADIAVVCQSLASSWPVLGQTLGFSRTELERVAVTSKTHVSAGRHMLEEWKTLYKNNATFFALLGALEIIQRRDIADDLVTARMCTGGIDL